MIPHDRPVIGRDLDEVRQQFGLLVGDALWLYGMSMTKWTHIVRRDAELPVTDPSLALLVRFLDENPGLSVIPKPPTAEEMYELLNGIQESNQRKFAVTFGSESSSAYRWLKAGGNMSTTVSRLMYFMKLGLMSKPQERRADMLENWRQTVHAEALARDVPDVFASGKWNPKGVAEKKAEMAEILPKHIAKKGRKKLEPKPE